MLMTFLQTLCRFGCMRGLTSLSPQLMWRNILLRDCLVVVVSPSMRLLTIGFWPLLIGGLESDGPFLGGTLGRWCALRRLLISGSLAWLSWLSIALLGFWDSLVRDRPSQIVILCCRGLQRIGRDTGRKALGWLRLYFLSTWRWYPNITWFGWLLSQLKFFLKQGELKEVEGFVIWGSPQWLGLVLQTWRIDLVLREFPFGTD